MSNALPANPKERTPVATVSSEIAPISPHRPSELTDKQLYKLCQKYGGNAKEWLRRFAGPLPEVYNRRLHRKYKCASIHEFAKKLAGMNERTVDKILRLYKKLEKLPYLLKLFESGEAGWSKIEVVAFIATPETDKNLAALIKQLPQKSLYKYIKEKRGKITVDGQSQLNLQISQNGDTNLNLQIPQAPIAYAESTLERAQQSADQGPQQSANYEPPYQTTHSTISFPISPQARQKLFARFC